MVTQQAISYKRDPSHSQHLARSKALQPQRPLPAAFCASASPGRYTLPNTSCTYLAAVLSTSAALLSTAAAEATAELRVV